MTGSSLSSADRRRLSERRRELLREQRLLNVRRFFRNGHAVSGALIILIMALLAVFAPLLAPADPLAQTVVNRFAQPGTAGYLLDKGNVEPYEVNFAKSNLIKEPDL